MISDTGIFSITVCTTVAKSSTSFGWGKGGKVTATGWQVTLCDPMWHVIYDSDVVNDFDYQRLHLSRFT